MYRLPTQSAYLKQRLNNPALSGYDVPGDSGLGSAFAFSTQIAKQVAAKKVPVVSSVKIARVIAKATPMPAPKPAPKPTPQSAYATAQAALLNVGKMSGVPNIPVYTTAQGAAGPGFTIVSTPFKLTPQQLRTNIGHFSGYPGLMISVTTKDPNTGQMRRADVPYTTNLSQLDAFVTQAASHFPVPKPSGWQAVENAVASLARIAILPENYIYNAAKGGIKYATKQVSKDLSTPGVATVMKAAADVVGAMAGGPVGVGLATAFTTDMSRGLKKGLTIKQAGLAALRGVEAAGAAYGISKGVQYLQGVFSSLPSGATATGTTDFGSAVNAGNVTSNAFPEASGISTAPATLEPMPGDVSAGVSASTNAAEGVPNLLNPASMGAPPPIQIPSIQVPSELQQFTQPFNNGVMPDTTQVPMPGEPSIPSPSIPPAPTPPTPSTPPPSPTPNPLNTVSQVVGTAASAASLAKAVSSLTTGSPSTITPTSTAAQLASVTGMTTAQAQNLLNQGYTPAQITSGAASGGGAGGGPPPDTGPAIPPQDYTPLLLLGAGLVGTMLFS